MKLALQIFLNGSNNFHWRSMEYESNAIVGVSRGYTDHHQGRAIHMADSRIH